LVDELSLGHELASDYVPHGESVDLVESDELVAYPLGADVPVSVEHAHEVDGGSVQRRDDVDLLV
jgi:hypothetical protein